jgi:hypothetical protein
MQGPVICTSIAWIERQDRYILVIGGGGATLRITAPTDLIVLVIDAAAGCLKRLSGM